MAARGRPPKPTQLHKLEGTFHTTKHSGRREPQAPGDLSDKPAPSWFSEAQRELWTEALLDAPRDLLRRIDWQVFANYIELADRWARAVDAQREIDRGQAMPFLMKGKQGPMISPYIRVINHCVLLMTRLQGELGFTPAARARFLTAGLDEDDDAGEWGLLPSLRVVQGGRKD